MQILRLIYPVLAAASLAAVLYYLIQWLLAWQFGARRALSDFHQSGSKLVGLPAQMGSPV
jgi:hypothetical protein